MFVPFHNSLILACKVGAYLSEASFRCSTLELAPRLTYKIRVGWKGSPGTNTQAYLSDSSVAKKKVLKHWPPEEPLLGDGTTTVSHRIKLANFYNEKYQKCSLKGCMLVAV